MLRSIALGIGCWLMWSFPAVAAEPAADVTYEQHVRPLLKTHCFHCHGESGERSGGLDLRLRRLVMQGGESGPAVVIGKWEESPLWTQVRDGEMPPKETKKRLTVEEVELLRRWVAAGAPTLRPEPADADPDVYWTEEERNYWAFQPLRAERLPPVKNEAWGRSGIDRLVLARLEASGLTPSEEAGRATLIRRLYIDLLGIPPTPDDVRAFLEDPSPAAYEQLVDRLLASPAYGERWGRHWLDTAGYADSEGYHETDPLRSDAWKYRDYVIRAFNADKPFDAFVTEQLAGDELVGRELKDLTPEQAEWLTATGFLRMAPDGTAIGGIDQNVARNEVVARTLDIVSASLLGLTVGCAECHDHRYDPITQVDYYSLRAIFEPALNWKNWLAPPARQLSLYTDADRANAAEVEKKARDIEAERNRQQQQFIEQTLTKELAKLPADLQAPLRAARDTPKNKRTPDQERLLREHPSVNVDAGSLYLYDRKAADGLKLLADEAAKVRAGKPKEEFLRALWEPANQPPPPTFRFHRGLFEQPKEAMTPRPPKILTMHLPAEIPSDAPELPSTGRRLAFSRWLVDARNPVAARVFVNRVWLHHFGRGIVATASDFGSLGVRPSHPELLDWLAREFITGGWNAKRLQRLIVTSATYRQSSLRRDEAEVTDQENRLLWRTPIRRMDAETLRDSMLAVTGQLDLRLFGPPVPVMADPVGQFVLGIENLDAGRPGAVISLRGEEFRRSVYVQARRSRPLSVMDPFDLPRMEPNCSGRVTSTVATQSLLLMNSEFMADAARILAERVVQEAGESQESQIRSAWRHCYAIDPTAEELEAALGFLKVENAAQLQRERKEKEPGAKQRAAERDSLATFCHALLSSNRFLYVD